MTSGRSDLDDAPGVPGDLAVIDTFLDGEEVSAEELRDVLERSEARAYLVDLLALRKSVGAIGPFTLAAASAPRVRSNAWWGLAAALASIITAASSYVAGGSHGSNVSAPSPTMVIQLVPGENLDVRRLK